MIDIATIVTRISTQTSYNTQIAKDILPNWQEATDLPIIYVGYATIDSLDPNVIKDTATISMYGENLVQTFEIHIVCSVSTFRATWVKVYNALIGWNPIATERQHTTFYFAQGGKMGISNGKLWDVSLWRIGFPTNELLT